MQPTPTKLWTAALLAFSSIGIAVDGQTSGTEYLLPTLEMGPVLLIEPLPMLLPPLGPVTEVKCIMRPKTAGCKLTLYKDEENLKKEEKTEGQDLTISHPVDKPEDEGKYKCVLCCTKEIPPFSVGTTPPGKTVQPETNSPSTNPTGTVQSPSVQASATTPGTTGPLTTFLKSLTTSTNPPSTPSPTTPLATTQVTTVQATGTTIQSATTVVTLPTTSTEATTESVTTTMRPTTIPTTATPSTVMWALTTQLPTTQLPTTQSPTTPSTATHSTTILSTTSAATAIPTTTGPCTNSSANATARPKFDTLQEAYPSDALKLKEDMGLPDWLFENGRPNTCAIRMSKAFHDAGLGIDRSRVDKSKCDTKTAGVSGKGKEYIIRALFFRCYLKAIWGAPDICDVKSEDDVKGKKGILIFTGCESFGQHIDLWDGESCSMACDGYFDRCSSVEFYELP